MGWFVRKGHDVSIITNTPKIIDGVTVYDIRRKPDLRPRRERCKEFYFNIYSKLLNSLNEIFRIRRLVKEIDPDIVHSHSLWYPGYLGVYLSFHPLVTTVLNGDILWKKDNINAFMKLRTKWRMKRADLITAESNELVNACIRYGASKDKVRVMRRGVDLKKFNCNGDRAAIRKELSLPLDARTVLSPRNTGAFYNLNKIV